MYQQQSLRSTSNFQLSKSQFVQEPARTASGFYKQHDKIQKNYEYQLEKYLKLKQTYPKTLDQKQSYYHNQTPKEKNSSYIEERRYQKPIHMNTLGADSQSLHSKYTDSISMTQSKYDFYKDDHKTRNQGKFDEKIRVENDYNNDYWNKTGYFNQLQKNKEQANHNLHYTYQLQDKLRMDYNNTINNRSQIDQSLRRSEVLNNSSNNINNNNNNTINNKINNTINYTDKIKVECDYNIDKVKKPVVSNTMQYMKERDQIMASLLTQEEVNRLKQRMVGRF